MSVLDDLKEMIAKQFDSEQDVEKVKSLGLAKQKIDEAIKENEELIENHKKLKDEYVKAVKSEIVSKDKIEQRTTKKTAMDIAKEKGFIK